MILISIGSNLPAAPAETPLETAIAGLEALPMRKITVVAQSGWFLSEPVPPSDQPWYVNGVAVLAASLPAPALLDELLAVEARFGRVRGEPNAPRTLDLDLLDYDSQLCHTQRLTLPHPRLHHRRFVLEPLCEVAPAWRHPRLGLSATQLLEALPPGQPVRRLTSLHFNQKCNTPCVIGNCD